LKKGARGEARGVGQGMDEWIDGYMDDWILKFETRDPSSPGYAAAMVGWALRARRYPAPCQLLLQFPVRPIRPVRLPSVVFCERGSILPPQIPHNWKNYFEVKMRFPGFCWDFSKNLGYWRP